MVLGPIGYAVALAALGGRRKGLALRHRPLDAGVSAALPHDLVLSRGRGLVAGFEGLGHGCAPFRATSNARRSRGPTRCLTFAVSLVVHTGGGDSPRLERPPGPAEAGRELFALPDLMGTYVR